MDDLIQAATAARKQSYSPYSNFAVGAAVQTATGEIYGGCNIENASYGLSMCAERNAIFNAVSAGHQELVAIAVIGQTDGPISPCGACRQVIAEFLPQSAPVYLTNLAGNTQTTTVAALLPGAFLKGELI
ncbi:cytidine deaminase [Lacticaseibacillus sp. N501-2]|uniref:cytidine deaminase n=1 Tax=Lacticaseibacillus salsurae TaxID=3367729 RepID=UPI0038B2F8E1